MSGFQTINAIWLLGALVLVLSVMGVRNVTLGTVVRSVVNWAAITLVVFVVVAHRHEIGGVFARISERLGLDEQQVQGKTVRIRMSPDGHFWARASLNGVEKMMLIDSGATTTAISQATASAAGIAPDTTGLPVILETANGAVTAKRAKVEHLAVGPLSTTDLTVVIAPSFGELDVLGMNFLSRLKSWRVEGKILVLEPDGKPDSGVGDVDRNSEADEE